MNSIGNRLKTRRMEQGLNQKLVADVAGVTNAAVSKWETNGGESMSAVVALKLSRHLNVNPFWLIFGEGRPTDEVHVPEFSVEAQQLARRIDQIPEDCRVALRNLLECIRT